MQSLKEYKDSVGMIRATSSLNKPEATIRSRIRSGKDWRVLTVEGKKRCVLIDVYESRA